MKRLLITALAVMLVGATGAFAGGSKESSGAATGPVQLTYLTDINVDTEGHDVSDNPYINFLDQKFNIKINVINEPNSSLYTTKLNTVMASGNLPDYLLIPNRDMFAMWATQGLLQPLDSYVAKGKYLPTGIDDTAWQLASVDGKKYGVPMERYDKSPYLAFVRKDWVQNLGIDVSSVKTIDDWHNMLMKFVKDDPNKDGANDTHGIVAQANSDQTLQMFLDAFNAAEAKYVNGEVLPNYMLPEYKDWLKFMHQLYVEKILDPEYVTTTSQQMWEKAVSGKYGMFKWFWSLQEYRSKGGKLDDLVPMKPPLKRDGSEAHYLYSSPVRHYIAITKAATPEKTQKVMDMMDWALSNDGAVFIDAGVEGLDYTLDNGQVNVKPDRRGKNWAWRFITLGIQKNQMDSELQGLLKQTWGDTGVNWLQMSNQTGMYDKIVLFAPYFDDLANFDFVSFEREYRDKAIIGQVNIDQTWDDHVKQWRASGGDQWVKDYTAWYKKTHNM